MSGRLVSTGLLALALVSALGCEDKVVKKKATVGSASANAPAAGSAAPSQSNGAKLVTAGPVAKMEISEGEFIESERSRDPFRSFANAFVQESRTRERSQRDVVLAQYAVDELKLIGIVTRITPAKAMLVDPTGRGHVIQRGQFVGRADMVQTSGRTGATYELNWRVDRIRDGDVVLVREDPNNPDLPSATKVIPLRPEGTLIEGAP
jgi:type IV pilus assembly protein PilP